MTKTLYILKHSAPCPLVDHNKWIHNGISPLKTHMLIYCAVCIQLFTSVAIKLQLMY